MHHVAAQYIKTVKRHLSSAFQTHFQCQPMISIIGERETMFESLPNLPVARRWRHRGLVPAEVVVALQWPALPARAGDAPLAARELRPAH